MERSWGWHGVLLAEHPARRCGLARLFFPLLFQTPSLALILKQELFPMALLLCLRVHNPTLHWIEQQTFSIFCLHLKANAAMVCNFNLYISHKKKPSGLWIPDEADTGSTFWCIYSFYFCDEYLFCGSVWSSWKGGWQIRALAWVCIVSVPTTAWRSSPTRSWNLMVVIHYITHPHGGHQSVTN